MFSLSFDQNTNPNSYQFILSFKTAVITNLITPTCNQNETNDNLILLQILEENEFDKLEITRLAHRIRRRRQKHLRICSWSLNQEATSKRGLSEKELQHFADNLSDTEYESDPFETDDDLDQPYETETSNSDSDGQQDI
ncbi:hypothetical protein HUJ04_011223 [Dendroctonus ponderosae]|nr:hypothetical protein HUJ04_011223 [Dendroctonus ponderosae]